MLRKEMLTLWGMLLTTYFHVVVILHPNVEMHHVTHNYHP